VWLTSIKSQQPAASSQHSAASIQQPATSNQQPATSSQQTATSSQRLRARVRKAYQIELQDKVDKVLETRV
jgi:hypothetical protein